MRCLLPDHAAATCTNPVVCLTCFRLGHRRSECDQPLSGTRSDPAQERAETPETTPHHPTQTQKPSPLPRKSSTTPLAAHPGSEREKAERRTYTNDGKSRQSSRLYFTRRVTLPTNGSASEGVVQKEKRRRRADKTTMYAYRL